MTNNSIFFSEISSLVPDDDVTNYLSTKINNKIKNISANISNCMSIFHTKPLKHFT